MFGEWCINGRVDSVFLLAGGVLHVFLKEVARDEGGERGVGHSGSVEEELPNLSKVDQKSRFFVSVHLRTCKTLNVTANNIQN